MSKKYNRQTDGGGPLLFYWYFKVCTEWAEISIIQRQNQSWQIVKVDFCTECNHVILAA